MKIYLLIAAAVLLTQTADAQYASKAGCMMVRIPIGQVFNVRNEYLNVTNSTVIELPIDIPENITIANISKYSVGAADIDLPQTMLNLSDSAIGLRSVTVTQYSNRTNQTETIGVDLPYYIVDVPMLNNFTVDGNLTVLGPNLDISIPMSMEWMGVVPHFEGIVITDDNGQIIPVFTTLTYAVQSRSYTSSGDQTKIVTKFIKKAFKLTDVAIKNMLTRVGVPAINLMLPMYIATQTNNSLGNFRFRGDQFKFDYRMTSMPKYLNGNLDFGFLAETFIGADSQCLAPNGTNVSNYNFVNSSSLNNSLQVVITDRFVNCIYESWIKSNLSARVLNTTSMTRLFSSPTSLTSGYLGYFMPFVSKALGSSALLELYFQPLTANVAFNTSLQTSTIRGTTRVQLRYEGNKTVLAQTVFYYYTQYGLQVNSTPDNTTFKFNYLNLTLPSDLNAVPQTFDIDTIGALTNYSVFLAGLNNLLKALLPLVNLHSTNEGVTIHNPFQTLTLYPSIEVLDGAMRGVLRVQRK